MEEKAIRRIIEKYIEAYNSFNVTGMLSDLHEDIKFVNISQNEVNMTLIGLSEFRDQAELAKNYFTERKQVVLDMIVKDDQAEINIDFKGIVSKNFPGSLKPGDKLTLKGKTIFKFKDQKIIEIKDII